MANGIDPYVYLVSLFRNLPAAKTADDFEALFPWRLTSDTYAILTQHASIDHDLPESPVTMPDTPKSNLKMPIQSRWPGWGKWPHRRTGVIMWRTHIDGVVVSSFS